MRRPHVSPTTAIALLALFLALGGGTAYAAHVINGKDIKSGSITGAKIKKNALTGTQINEAKLATVPAATHAKSADAATSATHATSADSATTATKAASATHADSATTAGHADSAGDASTVGGQPASAFAPASRSQQSGLVKVPADGQLHDVFTRAPLTWKESCVSFGGNTTFHLYVSSSEDARFTQGTGVGQAVTGGNLEIDNANGTGTFYTVTGYAVVGADGATYQGHFSAGLNVLGTPCAVSVTAEG